ncbi:RHS repeat-associated core domain protein containing protein [Pseudomonas sp. GM49]|uniref:RHS repeat domain-containing protein n=1 Tax=Pseudomonas sp. GM49 TaxID=1144331 RepID=UPI0002700657|nr:RHS repeat-associated core domain-containing protein [Pseudomonas sp. GM49]EJM64029.1 RHS repeat-associated core domain protein containing protein [Pseudomonas sp. GM49]
MPATLSVHRHTPTLTALDPRGLAVRGVGFWRDNDGVSPQTRVNRTVHDWAGRVIAQWDPRLFLDALAPANLQTIHALSGAELSTNSVDAGLRVALLGEAGQPLHYWDGRGSQRWMQYDIQLRPVSVFEQAVDGEAVCVERLSYGASDQAAAGHNQCGQLIRHDDPAGTQRMSEFGLHGTVLEQTRHFLRALSLPDWPEPVAHRDLLLEAGEGATSRSHFNAAGEISDQTDAKGHRQLFHQTLDGQLREVHLQLNGASTPKTLVSAMDYNAHGQTEREVAGNGVITSLEYDAQNGRLTRLHAQRGNDPLQDLRYEYDPVGNVRSIEDAALPIRYFANQRIEPVSRYFYDSLYQLIEALGWEAGRTSKGPQFSTLDDPAPRANYRQTYHYDAGGNLLELIHEGPQSHGHRLVAAARSNRCLPVLEGVVPDEEDFRRGFDANGNLLHLQPGQALAWDLRNQLGEVRPVERDSGLNDRERYVYGADGMRLRKVRETLAHARTLVAETRYLPNLELRNYSGTGEVLQVINVQAGRSSVRVLHWESAPPKDIGNDQYRYHLNDHLGSCTLELDDDGVVISQERYHPFGSTAWFAGRGEVEASYRTARYSGKERDATGLYYYGFRYYVAWWQRWLNPDPAGSIDGLNFFRMLKSSPINNREWEGLSSYDVMNEQEALSEELHGARLIARGLGNFPDNLQRSVKGSLALGENWLDETISALESNQLDAFTSKILEFSFGTDYRLQDNDPVGLKRQLLGTFKRLKTFIGRVGGEEDWRLSLADNDGRFTGNTVSTAAQGNLIWLSRSFIEKTHPVGLAATLLHEGLHAMGSFSSINFINDFWYVGAQAPSVEEAPDGIENYLQQAMNSSFSRVVNPSGEMTAPSEVEMTDGPRGSYIRLLDELMSRVGEAATTSSDEREDLYRDYASVRQAVVLRNSDSLTAILMVRHRP